MLYKLLYFKMREVSYRIFSTINILHSIYYVLQTRPDGDNFDMNQDNLTDI